MAQDAGGASGDYYYNVQAAGCLMQQTIAAGLSRRVAAAVAATLYRLLAAREGYVKADVPIEVAEEAPIVMDSLALQKLAGELHGTTYQNAGLAYQALRVDEPVLAQNVRVVNRMANVAKHGRQRGGRRRKQADLSTTAGDTSDPTPFVLSPAAEPFVPRQAADFLVQSVCSDTQEEVETPLAYRRRPKPTPASGDPVFYDCIDEDAEFRLCLSFIVGLIYFLDCGKFGLDRVVDLGTFFNVLAGWLTWARGRIYGTVTMVMEKGVALSPRATLLVMSTAGRRYFSPPIPYLSYAWSCVELLSHYIDIMMVVGHDCLYYWEYWQWLMVKMTASVEWGHLKNLAQRCICLRRKQLLNFEQLAAAHDARERGQVLRVLCNWGISSSEAQASIDRMAERFPDDWRKVVLDVWRPKVAHGANTDIEKMSQGSAWGKHGH